MYEVIEMFGVLVFLAQLILTPVLVLGAIVIWGVLMPLWRVGVLHSIVTWGRRPPPYRSPQQRKRDACNLINSFDLPRPLP